MADRSDKIKDFHKKVILLSHRRTQKEAYLLIERLEKKRNGARVFKNYESYKSNICWRRKNGKL